MQIKFVYNEKATNLTYIHSLNPHKRMSRALYVAAENGLFLVNATLTNILISVNITYLKFLMTAILKYPLLRSTTRYLNTEYFYIALRGTKITLIKKLPNYDREVLQIVYRLLLRAGR